MFNKKMKADQIDTVIGPGTSFQGTIEATGMVRIDGDLKGSIKTKGNIVVGENGHVEGDLTGLNVTIAGKVLGGIIAIEKIQILSSSQIKGDLNAKSIFMEDGAKFDGSCKMINESEKQEEAVVQAS